MNGKRVISSWIGCLTLGALTFGAAQTQSPPRLRVESRLVLVPVFVFDKQAMSRPDWKQWNECLEANQAAFVKLLPTEPYLPKTCRPAFIRGLTARDFQVFQDGAKQAIQSITVERWAAAVRDDLSWHFEISYSPSGKWLTPDLGQSTFYTDPMDPLYLLTYAPPESKPGSCHKIKIKVDHRDALVLARDEYCAGQTPSDPLTGTKIGKRLERDIDSHKNGSLHLSLQAGYFYAGAGKARVDVAVEAPWNSLRRKWELSNSSFILHTSVGVLGVIDRNDGTVAARFSDLAYPSYWPTIVSGPGGPMQFRIPQAMPGETPGREMPSLSRAFPQLREREYGWVPDRYAAQVDLPPGEYVLKVALDDGWNHGRVEMPLHIAPYGEKPLAMSSVILCRRFRSAKAAAEEKAANHFAPEFAPLISKGLQFAPAGETQFKRSEPLIAYFQVYEQPVAGKQRSAVDVHMKIGGMKTGSAKNAFRDLGVVSYEHPAASVIPVAWKVPISQLDRGAHQIVVWATNSAGDSTVERKVNFTIR